MRLWDWSLSAYARPGVEALCLTLQDVHGHCVPYLLWAAWTAAEGRAADSETLSRAVSVARDWDGAVTGPLRAIRRALDPPRPGVAAAGQRTLRLHLKTEELASERLLLEALEALTPTASDKPLAIGPAIAAAVLAWSPEPDEAVEARVLSLARAFSAD